MRITARGQVTILKQIRDAVGIKPGDLVEVRATASGAVIVEKSGTGSDYRKDSARWPSAG